MMSHMVLFAVRSSFTNALQLHLKEPKMHVEWDVKQKKAHFFYENKDKLCELFHLDKLVPFLQEMQSGRAMKFTVETQDDGSVIFRKEEK